MAFYKFVCFFVLISTCYGQMGKSTITQSKDGSGTISMGTPDLTDEESQSHFMPDNFRCDACNAIVDRYKKAIQKDIDKVKAIRDGEKQLSESRLIEIFEEICGDREWNNHGVKEVEGVKRLSYPGSEVSEIPGIMQGGGTWPRRLADMCYTYVGKHEEYGIYKAHRKDPKNGIYNLLCKKDCESIKSKRPHNEL